MSAVFIRGAHIEAAMRALPYMAIGSFTMINGERHEGWVTAVGRWHAVSRRRQTIEATADTWVVEVVEFDAPWPRGDNNALILALEGIAEMTFWSEEEMLAAGLYAVKGEWLDKSPALQTDLIGG